MLRITGDETMHMKYILGVVLAILVLAGGWYAWSTVSEKGGAEMESMHSDAMMEEMMESDNNEVSGSVELDSDLVVDPDAVVINVTGHNFEFDPTEIRVKEGDTVVINFTSTDGFHDWALDAFDAKTARVATGDTSSVTFVADAKGSYEYYCSVGNHRANGMVGTLIVE